MGRPRPNRKPSFFWQGTLILLPVTVMAIMAAAAIVKDRAAVEQEARQRAGEIVQQLNQNLARQVKYHWWEYGAYLESWSEDVREKGLWPGSSLRESCAAVRKQAESFRSQVRSDLSIGPNAPEADHESIKFWPAFNADGSILPRWVPSGFEGRFPVDEPPNPPSWQFQLSPAQAAAWEALCRASRDASDAQAVQNASFKFENTHPSYDARENADFIRLQAETATQPAANAIGKLLQFGRPAQLSPSGIPLSSLYVAEALKRAAETGPSEHIWFPLTLEIFSEPNFFTPVLLNLARPLTNNDPALGECLNALQLHWQALEQMWAAGEAIQRSGKLQGVTTTNFWLDFDGSSWFCLLEPVDPPRSTNEPAAERYTQSRLLSRAEVAQSFSRAIADAKVSIPRYFALSGELEGAPFALPSYGNGTAGTAKTVLAEATGSISTAGQPRYALRIHLADAGMMLSAHRQRALLFESLILASAIAAMIGFAAAWRAFYRQLRLNEMKSNFVSAVSHELRAPIASVRLMAEGLESGKIQTPEKRGEYFRFIVQECRRLSSLIENVLDFSRIEQGRKQYEMESTDLAALAQQTARLMETYAAEQEIIITFRLTGQPTPVELDGKAMQQALINLMDNAIKHSPKGAEVTVGLDHKPDTVSLWVEDRGEGIAAAEHEKIFERFYRIGSELRRNTQGVGIGLSIVKHIVEAHGGKVTVRSAPGEGSRFTIELTANGKRPIEG